jgi:hypothetical protein
MADFVLDRMNAMGVNKAQKQRRIKRSSRSPTPRLNSVLGSGKKVDCSLQRPSRYAIVKGKFLGELKV